MLMPTYEYRCTACQHLFEEFQSIMDKPLKKCPQCGGRIKRLIGCGAGIIFKGSGFYETDYKRKPVSSTAADKPADKPADKAGTSTATTATTGATGTATPSAPTASAAAPAPTAAPAPAASSTADAGKKCSTSAAKKKR